MSRFDPLSTRGAYLGFATAVLLSAGCAGDTSSSSQPPPGDETSAGTDAADGQPSWALPTDVADRVRAAGLDLGPMGMAEHYHPQLNIVIRGQQVPVPAGIGIDPVTGAMSALHTHTPDGVIHVEADVAGERFTLGQLFTQWDVELTEAQVGDVKARDEEGVAVDVNGQTYEGDPTDVPLQAEQTITVSLG
ncbi:hypothetical protein BH24ACT12_BH24ACT12_14390 [soil metagenome]